MAAAYCPECDALINVWTLRLGAPLRCPECEADLEVISTYPLEISFRFDYDDDGDGFDDGDDDEDVDSDWGDDDYGR